jgi:hypothetical protein
MFGIAGAHRTGKTTLAKEVAALSGIPYHDASISQIARELGVSEVDNLPIAERVKVQEHILKRYLELLDQAPRPCITDRTPLDMIGYMLGEVTMHNTTPEEGELINGYVNQCLEATKTHFGAIMITRPFDSYKPDPKSPPPNLAYQRLVQFIIEGASDQILRFVPTATLLADDLEARVVFTLRFFQDKLDSYAEARQSAMLC